MKTFNLILTALLALVTGVPVALLTTDDDEE
jgi:hypothetical protein